jgi:hypothetical protein
MIEAPAQQAASREAAKPDIHLHPTIINRNYINTGENKGVLGDNNDQTISDSFNTQGPDLAALLQALEYLQHAASKLPSSEAGAIRPQLAVLEAGAKTIQTESRKEKRNTNLLDLTKDGMITAAKTCAAVAPDLLKAATAIVDWFTKPT